MLNVGLILILIKVCLCFAQGKCDRLTKFFCGCQQGRRRREKEERRRSRELSERKSKAGSSGFEVVKTPLGGKENPVSGNVVSSGGAEKKPVSGNVEKVQSDGKTLSGGEDNEE